MAKHLSYDSPDWFRGTHSIVGPPKGLELNAILDKGRGRSFVETTKSGGYLPVDEHIKPQATTKDQDCLKFNPLTMSISRITAPKIPVLKDSVNRSRAIRGLRHDDEAWSNRHADELKRNARSFRRVKGAMENYMEKSVHNIDLHCWQQTDKRSQSKRTLRVFRPESEWYCDVYDLTNVCAVERNPTAPALRERCLMSRAYKEELLAKQGDKRKILREAEEKAQWERIKTKVTLKKPEGKQFVSDEILAFERKIHLSLDIKDMTKEEIKQFIRAEGLEMPQNFVWDAETATMKETKLSKKEYSSYLKHAMITKDEKPSAMEGIKVNNSNGESVYCVLSFYRIRANGVNVLAYNTSKESTHQLVLTSARLNEVNIPQAPKAIDQSIATQEEIEEDKNAFKAWTKYISERLVLISDRLMIGSVYLQSNGLPRNFNLFCSAKDVDKAAPPSSFPHNINKQTATLYFDKC